ncbi:hypothetical protein GGI12_003839 [Dipsacomyces acuminosporus]|nr:hypothetical protein GGI12_003839 [Dipsacomyces acuminosporus]
MLARSSNGTHQHTPQGSYSVVAYDDGTREVEAHIEFMRLAIQQANLAMPVSTSFSVGVIIVNGRQIVSEGYSREYDAETHAVACSIKKAHRSSSLGHLLRDSVLYTTMEPCSSTKNRRIPCTTHIINASIDTVVIGVKEPADFVDCKGVETLRQAGINVIHLMLLQDECLETNRHLLN